MPGVWRAAPVDQDAQALARAHVGRLDMPQLWVPHGQVGQGSRNGRNVVDRTTERSLALTRLRTAHTPPAAPPNDGNAGAGLCRTRRFRIERDAKKGAAPGRRNPLAASGGEAGIRTPGYLAPHRYSEPVEFRIYRSPACLVCAASRALGAPTPPASPPPP